MRYLYTNINMKIEIGYNSTRQYFYV